jgi:hypothetical protein
MHYIGYLSAKYLPPFFQLIPSRIKLNTCSFTDENLSRFFWDNPNYDVFIRLHDQKIQDNSFNFRFQFGNDRQSKRLLANLGRILLFHYFFFSIKIGIRDFLLDIYSAYKSRSFPNWNLKLKELSWIFWSCKRYTLLHWKGKCTECIDIDSVISHAKKE